MKKILALLLAASICLVMTACAKSVEASPPSESEAETEKSTVIYIDVGEQGCYNLLADVELNYDDDGELTYISLTDPTLLAFSVSERWEGGVCLISGSEMTEIMTLLHEMLQTYRSDALQDDLIKVIEMLENHPAMTGAST